MTYTPERQMFPPGSTVEAVDKQTGVTYTGVVMRPDTKFPSGKTLYDLPSENLQQYLFAEWNSHHKGTPFHGKAYNSYIFTKIGDPKMSVKSTAQSLRQAIQPYEKYLVAAAILLALDHFVLKGAMTDRIQRLAQSLADRLASMVDGLIARIGGGE